MRQRLVEAENLSLRALLPDAEFIGAEDIEVRRCQADSAACQPGDVFVALRGAEHDGHDFVQQAVAQGAAAVVAQRSIPMLNVPLCVVRDSHEAFGRICQSLAGNPSHQMKVVGVTGTNGKTTTTYLIASILDQAGLRPGVLGTLGYCDRKRVCPASLTTPPADELAKWLSRMVTNGCTHAVMEVSSHALSQSRVAGVEFDTVAVTNVRHDHLDFHGTVAQYRAAKARIFEHLSPWGLAVLDADDLGSASFLGRCDGPVLTVGIDSQAEVMAQPLEQRIDEQVFLLTAGDETVPVRTRLMGRHNIYNCLIAAAVGLAYEIDLPTIVRGLEAVATMPGRLERIDCGQPFTAVVDYAHTADALAATLDALRPLTKGRLICVFGAGGDRDRQKRPLMGRAVETRSDLVVVTSDNPRYEHPRAICDEIMDGFRDPSLAKVILDRALAIRWALQAAQPGACVVVAGKGHEDYQIIQGQTLPFDDRQVVRDCLYQQAHLCRAVA